MRELIREARRIQHAAVRAYIEQRVTLQRRELRRETESEIREALRMALAHDLGGAAFD